MDFECFQMLDMCLYECYGMFQKCYDQITNAFIHDYLDLP